jgi:RNA polymerase sigma-70 factor (ECF subfamily)
MTEESLEEVYKRLKPRMLAFAKSLLGTWEDAEDVVQTAFLKAWEKREQLKDESKLEGWLWQILRNTITDELRKRKYPTIALTWVIEAKDNEDIKRWLWDLIDRLPQQEREVIVLRFKMGMNIKEVAKRMGRSPAAVKALQYRAIRRLREMMDR